MTIYEAILKDHLKKSDIHPHVIKFGQAPEEKFMLSLLEVQSLESFNSQNILRILRVLSDNSHLLEEDLLSILNVQVLLDLPIVVLQHLQLV